MRLRHWGRALTLEVPIPVTELITFRNKRSNAVT